MPKKLAPGIYVYNSEQLSNCIDAIKNNIELFLTDGALVSKNVEGNPQGSYVDTNIRKVKVFSFKHSFRKTWLFIDKKVNKTMYGRIVFEGHCAAQTVQTFPYGTGISRRNVGINYGRRLVLDI